MQRRSNAGIEVLRCLAMFCIVLMHCATFMPMGDGLKARLIHVFCMFAVDAFALISGWFGVRFAWSKVGRFLGLGLYSSLALAVLGGGGFSYSLGWFGNAYLALICMSPLLNAAIECLRQHSERELRFAWAAYALVMLWSWLPVDCLGINVHVPGWRAHTFNQLCFMYMTGRVMRGCPEFLEIRKRWLFLAAAVCMAANYAWAIAAGLTRGNAVLQGILVGTRGYDNPIIIALSISLFLLFFRCAPPRWLQRVCLVLSPSMFMVYLLHEATNHDLSVALYLHYFSFVKLLPGDCQFVKIGTVALLVFAACILLDCPRRIISAWMASKLSVKGDK